MRGSLVNFFAVGVIIAAFFGILLFEGLDDKVLSEKFVMVESCDFDSNKTKKEFEAEAHKDVKLDLKYQQGLLHCYCYD